MDSAGASRPDFQIEIRLLLQVAMAVFAFTVVIGILNGADIVDFDNKTILAHVHSGTLGWLTLCVFAASLWLFSWGAAPASAMRLAARILTVAAIVTLPAFSGAFLLTYGSWRPILGSAALVTIAGFLIWVALRARAVDLTTPHLGFLAAVSTSVVGGVFGVLWCLQLATGDRFLPEDAEGAHPGTMVVGFLIPVGMALAEWSLAWPRPVRVSRLGVFQVGLPFIGGVLLAVGLLLDLIPLVVLTLPFEIAGVGILIRRMWPAIRAIDWSARSGSRLAAFSVGWMAVSMLLYVYLIMRYKGDFDIVPEDELLALDHIMFIGVMTNAVFGLLHGATEDAAHVWPWADDAIVWGMNLALAGFAVGLFAGASVFKEIFAPIMGPAILLGLVTYTLRLHTAPVPGRSGEPAHTLPATT